MHLSFVLADFLFVCDETTFAISWLAPCKIKNIFTQKPSNLVLTRWTEKKKPYRDMFSLQTFSLSCPSLFPFFSCSPVSCFLCRFLSLCHFLLSLSLPLYAFVSPFSVGESHTVRLLLDLQGITRTLFSCISMRWWALNNRHSQQTFKCASYMMGWCAALLLLLGVHVFWARERPKAERGLALSWNRPNFPPFVVG